MDSTATTPLLRFEGLRSGYGRAEVLHGLTLDAATGSVITVIGPNGAGKSTLLNTLMGVIPSRGTLRFDGEDIATLPLEERVMAGIALVPEKRELFASMPVEDNLVLGAFRQVRLGNRRWRDRIDDVYAIFPRLAVGRALMARPRLLMLDEPSLGLAPLVVREIFDTIEGLRKTGVTILLVEQNARAALQVADHGYVLEMGEFALQGPARALALDPRVIDTYLGTVRPSVES
jgi:branched-chain amino acid transport system ATP-binding protein